MGETEEPEAPPRWQYRNVAVRLGPGRWSLDRWQLEREYCRLGYRSEKRNAGPKRKSAPRAAKDRVVVEGLDGTQVVSRCAYGVDDMPEMHGDYRRVSIFRIGNAGRFVILARCLGGYCAGQKLVKMSPGKWMNARIQLRCARCNSILLAKQARMAAAKKGAA